MKSIPFKPVFLLYLFISLVSLACANSAPTPDPTETTSTPAETFTPATEISLPTDTPVPTPTQAPAPAALTYTWLSSGLVDFSGVKLEFNFLAPGVLYAKAEDRNPYRSADGGVTWHPVEPDKDLPYEQFGEAGVFRVIRDPHTPTTLYGFSEALQSFVKSVDSGETWTPVATPFSELMIIGGDGILEIDPRNPSTLFASDFLSVYKSTDGGETWLEIMTGIPSPVPSGFMGQRFIFDPSRLDTVYFLDGGIHGLYKSTNGGEQWVKIELPRDENNFYQGIVWAVPDPQDANTLYAASNSERLFKSADGGQTWQVDRLELPGEAVIQSLAIDPSNPSNWYAILQEEVGTLYKSEDGGQTWGKIDAHGYQAYGIVQTAVDLSGALYIIQGNQLLKTTDSGLQWNSIFQTEWSFHLVVNPQNPNILYIATNNEVQRSSNGGTSWVKIFSGSEIGSLRLDPQSPNILYLAHASQLMKSMDSGQTWQAIWQLGEKEKFMWLTVDPQTPSTLYASSSAWVNSNTQYAFYKSTDGGQTWQPANFGLPEEPYVTQFIVDPHTSTNLLAVVSGEIYKSTDGGQTWNRVGAGLPEVNADVETLVADPIHPSLFYAAIWGHGVYRSLNGGETWEPVSSEPSTVIFNSLIIDPSKPNTLYATSAEGLWVIQPER
ncbi:MAG: hypothetical protein Fur0022_05320 [Anaerolineales bacterium]